MRGERTHVTHASSQPGAAAWSGAAPRTASGVDGSYGGASRSVHVSGVGRHERAEVTVHLFAIAHQAAGCTFIQHLNVTS